MNKYIMESKWERYRLELKTKKEDSLSQLKMVGLRKGMKALDVGCGTGAVTRVMAQLVSPGKVIGVDFDKERLKTARQLAENENISNIEFKLRDISNDINNLNLPINFFDFIWSRFLFEYLKEPEIVLRKLKKLTVRGGKVVVADLDGHHGLFHYPTERKLEQYISGIFRGLRTIGFDPFIGRKLYNLFHKAGFKNIKVHILPYQVITGKAHRDILKNWQIKFKTLKPVFVNIFKDENIVNKVISEFVSYFEREDTFSFSLLFIVEGRVI